MPLPPVDPADRQAAERLGHLFDGLRAAGFGDYPTQDRALEELLVRVVCCCFAEDTGLFAAGQFRHLLQTHTRPDGTDTAAWLHLLFQTLSQPAAARPPTLPPELATLPHLGEALFGKVVPLPTFTAELRERLLACTHGPWAHISPPVFGALFQSLHNAHYRQHLGEHYTPEAQVFKVIGPLFLEELRQDLAQAGHDAARLDRLHARLAALQLFDPACGNGAFLAVAYRELRLLELALLQARFGSGLPVDGFAPLPQVELSQCAGLESDAFLGRVAELVLWLLDQQLNQRLAAFGLPTHRSPLVKARQSVRAYLPDDNWASGLPPVDYFFGNFTASRQDGQRGWLLGRPNWGESPWGGAGAVLRVARYLTAEPSARAAFLLLKQATQGAHNATIWQEMQHEYGVVIQFAHRPFARNLLPDGRVYERHLAVVVGIGRQAAPLKQLFAYDTAVSEPRLTLVPHINHYLLAAPDVWFAPRLQPLANVPPLAFGSYPSAETYVLLNEEQYRTLLAGEPAAAPYLSRVLPVTFFRGIPSQRGANLQAVPAAAWAHLPALRALRDAEHQSRLARLQQLLPEAGAQLTRRVPAAMPTGKYVALPLGVDEDAVYLSAAYVAAKVLPGSRVEYIPQATPYLFGMVISAMFSAWVRQLCGRWKYGYENEGLLTYHNFPFPAAPTPAQMAAVATAVATVRAQRGPHPSPSPVYDYWINYLSPERAAAAAQLDVAVDRCFRPEPFTTEQERLEFLLAAYQQQAAAQ
ncbi:hypothetical protein E4631_24415 [Hymenobacter sp. UV11]|uniref:DNA methyltransferase n=1 Tax=Hymenobacter sp. UV11 TaxID=1849735 RepID=UPI00105B5327|nr:DNA methyltransferase [Hymenobacter sp. UV11]TDN35740.1 hypothetical protein A8B98_12525 [Hymenobacter sp. UV11]TFZ62780.1 hypothetical protein E4631_24415 [Hymenobacter sp. UV11]